mgnify:CR=1 FL=1
MILVTGATGFLGARVVAAASRGPATFSMQVTGLGSETDRRPVEMIHADADKAFKFLDTESVGSIDNEKLRNYLKERDYDAELVDKIFAGIGATYLKSVPSVATIATVCVSMNQYFAQKNKTEHEAKVMRGDHLNDNV